MQHRLLSSPTDPQARRSYALILDTGDEFVDAVTNFAREQQLSASQLTGIGAFSSVVLGFFEWDRKEYRRIVVDEQVEVVALLGDIALTDDRATLHAHVTVAKSDGSAWGGHLLSGNVRPTLEVIVTEAPTHLMRKYDPTTGLALLNTRA